MRYETWGEAPIEKFAAVTSGLMAGTTPLNQRTARTTVRAAATVNLIQNVVRSRSWPLKAFLRVTSITTFETDVVVASIRPMVNARINANSPAYSYPVLLVLSLKRHH